MSIKIMTALWDMQFSPVEKLVYLAIADCANDEGLAWPSIATIARKTGVGERTVQRAIRSGEKSGLIARQEIFGKGCKYTIDPRHSGTPARKSPVPESAKTPATVAPHPRHSGTQTIIEPSKEPSSNNSRAKPAKRPDGVSEALWRDWKAHRKTPFTETALAGFEREAAKAGWPLEAALTEAIERGWQGFKADWVKDKENGRHQSNGHPADGMGRTERAVKLAVQRTTGITAGIGRCAGDGQETRHPVRLANGDDPHRPMPHALRAIGFDDG